MRELGKIITVKPEPETTPSLTDIIQKEKAVQTVSEYLFTAALRGHFKRVFDCVVNVRGRDSGYRPNTVRARHISSALWLTFWSGGS